MVMKKRNILLAITAAFAAGRVSAQADPGCAVQPTTLKAMRSCYRPVLVFAADPRRAQFAAQQALLEQYADDMMDRNLLYVPILAHSAGFDPPLDAPYALLKPSEMDAIRARFRIAAGEFMVLLVGKDGGEKFRSGKPVSVLKLDDLVDAMPMGMEEKRGRTPRLR